MGMNLGGYCGRNQCSLEEMEIAELGLLRHGKRRLLEDRKEINYTTLHTTRLSVFSLYWSRY